MWAHPISHAFGRFVCLGAVALAGLSVVACDSGSNAPTSTVKPQATTSSRPLTGQELAWLQGVTKLQKRTEKEFTSRTSEVLTTNRMRSYAKLLRGCGGQLARLGPPSARLQPVYAIADNACGQADKGARCFAVAAKISTPIMGTASERKSTKAINCGVDALGDSINLLGDAVVKMEEIKAEAGQP
jgi:hypothetical protein